MTCMSVSVSERTDSRQRRVEFFPQHTIVVFRMVDASTRHVAFTDAQSETKELVDRLSDLRFAAASSFFAFEDSLPDND